MVDTERIPLELAHVDYWNDNVHRSGKWFCVKLLSSATFSALTITNFNATPTGVALPAGTEIFGDITEVKLFTAAPYVLYSLKETQLTVVDTMNISDAVTVKVV